MKKIELGATNFIKKYFIRHGKDTKTKIVLTPWFAWDLINKILSHLQVTKNGMNTKETSIFNKMPFQVFPFLRDIKKIIQS